ncbi:MAG: hypothetical protein WCR49_10935 [Opitutae bacterium]
MNTSKKLLLAAAFALTACLNGFGQVAPPPSHPAANIDLSKLTPEMRALVTQLQSQAVQLRGIADTLRAQLKDKTADQRKAIIDQFRKDNAAVIDAQRELAKQIRAEMKQLRDQRKGTG